jgi:hypothetical protein
MRKLFVLLLLLSIVVSLYAQTKTYYKKYSQAELIFDFNFLVKTIEDVHPNIYTEIDSITYQQEKKSIFSSLSDSLNSLDYFKIISPIIAKIGDAHTVVVLPWNEWEQYVNNGGKYFPFLINYNNGIRVIKCSDSSDALEIGTRLLKVNGFSCDSLYEIFKSYRGGERKEYKDFLAANYFRYYLWLNQINPPYSIVVTSNNGNKIDTIFSDGIGQNKSASSYYYNFKYLPEKIGYIDFRAMYNQHSELFDDFLKRVFTNLKQDSAKGLIVDLRNNYGGHSSFGDDLLEFITAKPFRGISKKIWKSSSQYRDNLREQISWPVRWLSYPPIVWLANLFSKEIDMFTSDDGNFVEIDYDEIQPGSNPLRYQGKVCFLIGVVTFSSGVDLANAVKDYNIAPLFGEETGGVPNCFGEGYSFSLPNTHIEVSVSSARFVRANGDEKTIGGIKPDYEIKTSLNDIKIGRDPVMEKVVEYILK